MLLGIFTDFTRIKIPYIYIFTEYFDKSLCSLIRMESDGEPDESGSPHIFVVQAER